MSEQKIPLVFARVTATGGWSFWCPFCRTWHRHGPGAGHKVAHCTEPDSPFKKTGYHVRLEPVSGKHKFE